MDISLGLNAARARTGEDLAGRWGPAAIAICGAFMTAIGWMKWGDLMIDYGAQVYLPWRIAEGQVLYRDINYLYGPLSGHVHALLFVLFGPGIRVLVFFNLLLVAALAGLIFILFRRSADALTATLCGMAFMVVFALGQYQGGGNFNFVTAYNYDLTHGVFLGFAALALYQRWLERPGTGLLMAMGLLTGLAFLTKPEAFLALFAAMLVGLPLALYYQDASRRTKFLKMGLWLLTFLAVPLMFWMYLALRMPAGDAFRGLVGPWLHVFDPYTRSLPLYQWVRGVNDFGGNLAKMIGYALGWAAVLGLIHVVQRLLAGKPDNPFSRTAGGWALVLVLSGLIGVSPVPWMELVRPLPLFVLGYGFYQVWNLKRATLSQKVQPLFLLVFCVFAFALMLKILFNVHVFHYGFALALPAFLLFIRFVVHDGPRRVQSGDEIFPFARLASAALVLVFVMAHGHISYKLYQLKNYKVGTGPDAMLEYYPFLTQRGPVVNAALEYIDQEMDPNVAFPVLPGGSMLNYLSRHPNPFPFIFFTPPEVHFYGEDAYLRQLKMRPPPYIVFVEMDHAKLGARYFGRDFAQTLHAWIMDHYNEAALFGERPFTGNGYGILFLKRKPTDALATHPSTPSNS